MEEEILNLEEILIENPQSGIPLGANLYKILLASKAKGKGKSGGFRIVTYLRYELQDQTDIYLVTIVDKSEESNIHKNDLVKIVKPIFP